MLITLKWAWNSHCFRVSTSSHKAQGTRHKNQLSWDTQTLPPLIHCHTSGSTPKLRGSMTAYWQPKVAWKFDSWIIGKHMKINENHMKSEKNVLLSASSFSTTSRVSSFFISCRTWGSTTGSKSVIDYRPAVQRCFKTGSCRNRWNQNLKHVTVKQVTVTKASQRTEKPNPTKANWWLSWLHCVTNWLTITTALRCTAVL